MQRRQGIKDVGMEYQFKVITYVAASLSNNHDVEDFIIFSNADNIPGFDDLIVKVWFKTKKEPYVYLGQVKHRHSKINFDGEKHKLADYEEFMTKIIKNRNEIQILRDVPSENIEFWFYSNNFVSKDVKIIRKDEESNPITCDVVINKNYKSIIQFEQRASCFKLVPKDSNVLGNSFRKLPQLLNELSISKIGIPSEEIFHRFHLFLNQSNNSKIDYDISQLLEFSKESTEKIIKYVDKFLNIPKITGLTKRIFETEILNIHLSNITVKPTTAIEMNTNQARIWNKIILIHDLTLVDDIVNVERSLYGCFVQQIADTYQCQFDWNNCIRNNRRLKKDFDVQKFVDRSKLQQIRYWLVSPDTIDALVLEMWKNDELPLILKPTSDISIILQKFKHLQKKFIIIGAAKQIRNQISSYSSKIFTDVSNICSPQLKDDLLNNIMVSLQGRNPVRLSYIIADDHNSMEQLTCQYVLDLIKKRKMYLCRDCFDETELKIFIITDDSSSEISNVNAIKGNDNSNILIRGKENQVDMYIKQIKSRKDLENFTIHVLRQEDFKFEYLYGRRLKIRSFLVDQEGESIHTFRNHEAIPVIGNTLGLKDDECIRRKLRKATIDITSLDKVANIICLVYGDINSLDSNVRDFMEELTDYDLKIEESVVVTIQEQSAQEHWTRLCSKNHKLILLQAINGCLVMIKYKNIRNIGKYILHSGPAVVERRFFKEFTNNLILISGEPGMGKSFLLNKLSEFSNDRNYVLHLNLSDYRRDFQESTKILEDPINYLFKKMKLHKFQNFIESTYVFHRDNGRLTLFLDSFDEILPFYEATVLNLLELVIKSNIRVVVCSRLISESILLDKFDVQLARIDPIEKCELVEYLERRNVMDMDLDKIPNIFLENPLYLKFLIYLHQYDSVDFTQISVVDLYQKFIAKIVERYCHKYNQDYNPKITISTEMILKNHRLLALLVIFGKEFLLENRIITNYEQLESEFKCMDFKLGFIKYFNEGYPIFIHRTFAECMVAQWLYINLYNNEPSAKIIYEKMYRDCDLNVRYLFDNITCKELPLHKAVLNGDFDSAKNLCTNNDAALTRVDQFGRTALHLASTYCWANVLEQAEQYEIVEVILKNTQARGYDLMAKDNILNWNWIDYFKLKHINIMEEACRYNLPTILNVCLTQGRAPHEFYIDICNGRHYFDLCIQLLDKSDLLFETYLAFIVTRSLVRDHLDSACRLMELAYQKYNGHNMVVAYALHLVSNSCKFVPLHIACMQNDKATLMNLLVQEVEVNETDLYGRIPLHYSAIHGAIDMVSLLISYGADADAGDIMGNTALHFAFRYPNVDIIRLLLKNGVDISKKNDGDQNALAYALWSWKTESEDSLAVIDMFAKEFEEIANPSEDTKSLLRIIMYRKLTNVKQILLDKVDPQYLNYFTSDL